MTRIVEASLNPEKVLSTGLNSAQPKVANNGLSR